MAAPRGQPPSCEKRLSLSDGARHFAPSPAQPRKPPRDLQRAAFGCIPLRTTRDDYPSMLERESMSRLRKEIESREPEGRQDSIGD